MARTVYHSHAYTGKSEPTGYSGSIDTRYFMYCGEDSCSQPVENTWSKHPVLGATCPKCGQAWGKEQLKLLGERIRTEPLTEAEISGYWKSGVKVWLDGVLRAVVFVENGWGKKWSIAKFKKHPTPTNPIDGRISRYDWYGSPLGQPDSYKSNGETKDGTPIRDLHRAARDAMIALVPALVEGGFLPTPDEQKAADDAKEAERVDQNQRYERQREEARENRKMAIDALSCIRQRAATLGLTNYEIAGIEAALKVL
jgi:hypothetical protein